MLKYKEEKSKENGYPDNVMRSDYLKTPENWNESNEPFPNENDSLHKIPMKKTKSLKSIFAKFHGF